LQTIPKVFISLIPPPDITILDAFVGLGCLISDYSCPCKSIPATSALYPAYVQALRDLAASYVGKDDFYVTVQPFFEKIKLPRNPDGSPNKSYFSIDCFHLSAKGHAAAGQALWNNLMQPTSAKATKWEEGEPWICPESGQYLQ